MSENTKQRDFVGQMFKRMLSPCIASGIGLALADIADAVVVGNQMGAVGLAAIGMTLPVFMILNVFMHGFGTGGGIAFSILLAEGKKDEADRSFNSVIRSSLIIGLLIALSFNIFPEFFLRLLGTTPSDGEIYTSTLWYVRLIAGGAPLFFMSYIIGYYLRNDGKEKLAATAFTIGNAVDLALNIVFVLIFKWGTVGAGLATLTGLAVTLILYIPGLRGKNGQLRISFRRMPLDFTGSLKLWAQGFSTSSQYLCQMIFIIVANNVLMRSSGENGVAVFDMIQNASYLTLYLYEGTNRAQQPLVSALYGEKNYKDLRRARKLAMKYGLIFGASMAALIAVFAPYVCRLFGLSDSEVLKIGVPALWLFCISSVFAGWSIMTECYYQSVDNTEYSFVIVLLRGCAVLLPATFIIGRFFTDGFWLLFLVTEALSLGIFLLFRIIRPISTDTVDKERIFSTVISGDSADAGDLAEKISEFCEKWDAGPKQQYFMSMSAEEICLAIIEKGFSDMKNAADEGIIQITLIASQNGEFELHIRDNAVSFDPFALNDTALTDGDFDMNAVGMTVIKKKAKSFFYHRYGGFNSLVLTI